MTRANALGSLNKFAVIDNLYSFCDFFLRKQKELGDSRGNENV
jgi:hypothetical protein